MPRPIRKYTHRAHLISQFSEVTTRGSLSHSLSSEALRTLCCFCCLIILFSFPLISSLLLLLLLFFQYNYCLKKTKKVDFDFLMVSKCANKRDSTFFLFFFFYKSV